MSSDTIPFPLDEPAQPAALTYRPWGTRALKLHIKTKTAITEPLRIRPQGVRPEEAEKGISRAYADDSDSFVLSWGGGHEPGPCLKSKDFLKALENCVALDAGDESVIFFNVTHVGPDVPETAVVTIIAFNEKTPDDPFATLQVTLKKAADYTDEAIQLVETAVDRWQPQGSRIATYDPRWWPKAFTYQPEQAWPLAVVRQDNALLVQWDGKTVASITDHTDPTILDMDAVKMELFRYDQWHLALRIWFFWLDTNIGGGFFVGRHEVPDAERFDMLIRAADGRVTLACTDLHWREVWGEIEGEPMRATIGLTREVKLKLAKEEMGKLFKIWENDAPDDDSQVYDPNEDWVPRIAKKHGQAITTKAKGTEAHLPTIHNFSQSNGKRFTSSDVRHG